MNCKVIAITFALLFAQVSIAQDAHYEALFEQANGAYKAAEYDSAKALYNEIAENGMISSKLFYNLANSHFKLGNVPASILFYERALRLDPNNEDIRYNLSIANGLITDKIEAIEKPFFVDWWNNVATSFSSSFWAVAFLLNLTAAAVLLTFFFISKTPKIRQLGMLGGLVLLITSVVVYQLGDRNLKSLDRSEAIVFAPSVKVKSEPSLNGSDQFVIHAGLKVEATRTEGEWTQIRLADGNTGWLPNQSIEAI